MSMEISQFFQVFFDEADELLAEAEHLLLGLDPARINMDDIDAIFRAAHSIKGGAATFGLSDMTGVTHVLENLLDRLRKSEMGLTVAHIDAFLRAKDVLKMQLDGHRHGHAVHQPSVEVMLAELHEMTAEQGVTVVAGEFDAEVKTNKKFRIGLPDMAANDIESLAAELGLLGEIVIIEGEGTRKAFMLETAESTDDICAICSFVIDPATLDIHEESANAIEPPRQDYEIFDQPLVLATPKAAAASTAANSAATSVANTVESSSIRVSIEKVDQLINLVGELVITQAMIEQRTHGLDPMLYEKLLNGVSQLTRNTRHLQEAVMSIRMMPMDYVFSRFPRMVRDLSAKLGKKVELQTQGAATELDKGLIERIIDPLTHLIRNSVDHGIEMPAARAAAGKDEVGILTLSAAHRGGHIVIEVSDDGGGLQRERILAKAAQQGLAVSDAMTDAEVWQLIFAAGFSTAEAVTDVSGRGVGMDVVKRNIAALGGQVEVCSVQGRGTTILISLPLTLAIVDGMSIKSGDEIYILPLNYVLESLQPLSADVSDIPGYGTVVKVRGDYLPLISLKQEFAITGDSRPPSEGIVVILEADGKRAAIQIDELVGQQQVVVKNLEANYRRVTGVSGATILGDGSVALILDVSALLRSALQPVKLAHA